MKFTLVQNPIVWWPVTVRVPDQDRPGKVVEQELMMQFVIRDRDDVLERQDYYATLPSDRDRIDAEAQDMLEVVRGWDEVVDGNGNPVAFSPETLRAAWKWTWFRIGVHAAMAEIMLGKEAKAGN